VSHESSSDRIRLSGLRFHGYHGVFDHERANGQPFVVDLELRTDLSRAAATDDLAETIDYGVVASQVEAVVTGEPVQLIETVAQRIADAVLADPRIVGVLVTLHKPEAPIEQPFDNVAVVIERRR
jgi:dihydroneopterin aldolase